MKTRLILSTSLALLLCVGCRLGPKYKGPDFTPPENWKNGESCDNAEEPQRFTTVWWELFDDPVLSELEERALECNPSIYVALDRVAEARAMAGVSRSYLYPQINLLPGYSSTGTLFQILLPSNFSILGQDLANSYRIHQMAYSMPFTMRYEIDLWGKLAGRYDSARYYAQVQFENFKNVMLTLTADVAFTYYQIRTLDAQIVSLEKDVGLLKNNVNLVSTRYNKGLVGYLDVVSAEQILATTEASYYDAVRQRGIQENALATLLGMPASNFCLPSKPLEGDPPFVPAGLPSDILLQRPDIAAAERNMASLHAMIGVAYASFLPSIELTGTLGYFSPQLDDFMKWKSRLWMIGVDAAQTIFDAERNKSNLDLTYAQYNEASNQYKQTVLSAFQEVEDALINIEMQKNEYESFAKAANVAETRMKLSKNRYSQGLVGYLEVIDSDRTGIEAQLNVSGALGARYAATIQLIKALGGGWCY